MKSPVEIQEDIVREFQVLDEDPEMTVLYIMELGERLPPYPEEYRTEGNLVKGCQSKVWMMAQRHGDRVDYDIDSNTAITKGLASILVRIFSGQTADTILSTELTFMGRINMERFIGTQRSNGFAAMIRQMKYFALVLRSQTAVK